jgi:hypothetical protein
MLTIVKSKIRNLEARKLTFLPRLLLWMGCKKLTNQKYSIILITILSYTAIGSGLGYYP